MAERPGIISVGWVTEVMRTKAWYGFDQNSGAFHWPMSVRKLAESYTLSLEEVNEAIASSFTPACLSQVLSIDSDGELRQKPLLSILRNEGITPHIWTVGDREWQKTKFERTGANGYIPSDHFHCSEAHKENALIEIINNLSRISSHYIVVDDKPSNIDFVASVQGDFRKRGITLQNYHMKLSDTRADATAFYHWLREQLTNIAPNDFQLILDFDGVVADTDSVLFGPAVEKILRLLTK